MKKSLFFVSLLFLFSTIFAEQFRIEQVEYDIEGCGHWIFGQTQEYALENTVPVDTKTVFQSEEELNEYLKDFEKQLSNLRAFETIDIIYEEIELDDGPASVTPLRLNIYVKDSFHLFAIPGPKYDSNSGLTLKLKIKDSNFLGGLNTLNSDIYFLLPTSESDGKNTEFGFNCSADYPFKAGIFDALWLNDLGLSYTVGDSMPEWNIGTGIRLTLPFNKVSLVFEANQKFANDFKYKEFDDNLYFVNDFKFYVPLTIARMKYFGKLNWTPYTITTINWDHNGISQNNSKLSSPILDVGHKLSFGRTDWEENFRTGLIFELDNSYSYNFQRKRFYPAIELDVSAYKKFELFEDAYLLRNIGIAVNTKTFAFLFNPLKNDYIFNDGKEIGQYLRGIRDSQNYKDTNFSALTPTNAFVLNLDFPIHAFRTNFSKGFLRYMNFDLQVSPFLDMALCYNKITKTIFDPKDGFYAAGLEVIVYPLKWSGITIRGSVGVDVGRKFLKNYINMDWRENVSKKEFSIGFGLHY